MNDLLVLEVRRLREAVAELQDEQAELRRCLLTKADRRRGALLVPALARLFGAEPFNVHMVGARVLNDDTPPGGVVRDALQDYADDDGGRRGFGRLLTRLHGVRFGHMRLVPVGGSGDAQRWRVQGFEAE